MVSGNDLPRLLVWGSSLGGSLVTLALSLWVLSEGPRTRAVRSFGWTLLAVSAWGMMEFFLRTAPDAATALLWTRLLPISWAWVPPLFLYFAASFTGHPLSRRTRFWRVLFLLPFVFITMAFADHLLYLHPRETWWGWGVQEGPFWFLAVLYFALLPFLSFLILLHAFRHSPSPQRRSQLLIITVGAAMPYIPALIINGMLPILHQLTGLQLEIPGLAFLGAVGMGLLVAIGVVRYQMFQLDSPRVLSTLFDVLEEGVLVLDREGRIRLVSPSLKRMFDLQEDLTGLTFSEVFQYIPRSYPIPHARLVLCRLTQQSTVVLEHRRSILLDRTQFGEVLSWIAAEDLAETARRMADMLESLREEARLDPLTGLYNRRHLKTRLREVLALYHRYQTPATLVLMDLDHFKEVNDRFGHPTGDRVLREVAEILRNNVREGDEVFRYGGDEFVILLPNTPETGGIRLAERLLTKVQSLTRTLEGILPSIRLSASFGVAQVTPEITTPDQWLERVDRPLYRAKGAGRGTIVVAGNGHSSRKT